MTVSPSASIPAAVVRRGPAAWLRDRVDRLLARRDRLVAGEAFRRFAARSLFTRGIARRRARALFDLVAGFSYSQILAACVELDLFATLLERPRGAAELAALHGLDADALDRLLAGAVALRLVERRRGDRYGLGPLGAPLAGDRAIASMVEHHAALYADLADPVALLRGGASTTRLGALWGYARAARPETLDDARVAAYSTLMSASQPLVASQLLDAYPVARHRCLLDVGGGEGRFLIEAAARAPALALMLFDLPAVAARADARLAAAGLSGRARTFGGDFARDALPRGADLVTLVRVIHDHDDDRALAILRAVHAALPDGGVLLVAEPMSDTRGAETVGDAYFGMYLLAMGSGRPRTPAALTALLEQAGFRRIRALDTTMPLQARVLRAMR